jgi:pimeloyl-ACP methyl ester carboxylesterase
MTGLPEGVTARRIEGVNGLSVRLLEAGPDDGPLVLLLHGFPELAFSWRHQLPALAAAGFHAVAPDQRGYGGTTGHDPGDLAQFRLLNLARDALGVAAALGHKDIACVVGHDFGSPVAGLLALVRPDLVRACVLMSAPFPGPPAWPLAPRTTPAPDLAAALASLTPPRQHYQLYYATDAAAAEMDRPPQGLHAFLRAYYHVKSADWAQNRPHPLAGWDARELAKLPDYYVMPLGKGMAETVAPDSPTAEQVAACGWLPDEDMAVYAEAFAATGFGPALMWYRAVVSGAFAADMEIFAGRGIACPSAFIAGEADWGIYQAPGAFEAMQARGLADKRFVKLVPGAGHWVQQEQPDEVNRLLLEFLGGL